MASSSGDGDRPAFGRTTFNSVAQLSPRDLAALARAATLYLVAEVGLRVTSLPSVAKRLGVTVSLEPGDAIVYPRHAPWFSLSESELRSMRMVRRLSPWLYGHDRGCLRRSLVLARLLRQRHAVIRLGVQRNGDGSTAAHAWVEVDGVRLEPARGYLPFEARR